MTTFISLGFNCRPASNLRRRGCSKVFPFDVVRSVNLQLLIELILDDFKDFLSLDQYEQLAPGHGVIKKLN